jgi:S-adenosylmethionine-diacylglycerol 3-amino-3-carboxypropyl transferase
MMSKGFYERLNYSLGNETWQAESLALGVKAQDSVLCVTASGDRPLHVLLDNPQRVVAIDNNPLQNHLLELKMQAMRSLDYKPFLAFMGVTPSSRRIETYEEFQRHLSRPSQHYWARSAKKIAAGVVFQGKTERYCLFASRFLKLLFGRKTRKLLSFDCVDAQAKFVDDQWNSAFHRWLYRASLCFPKMPRISVFDDPGLHAYVDAGIDPAGYMYDRKNRYLKTGLARNSLLLQLLYHGGLLEEGLPSYLRQPSYEYIKDRVDRIEITTADVASHLRASNDLYDVFSLSDIASYMPYARFAETLNMIRQRANTGARFCIREYMTRYGIPDLVAANFVRDTKREQMAEACEANFVYHFMAGHIR